MPEPKPSPAIRLRGVRHNNLKNFDLDLPLHRLIVIAGLSGSGKSSLAFDTLYAEGQRRYIESLSTYARMFLDRVDRPDVDRLENVRPGVALEQKNPVRTAGLAGGAALLALAAASMLYVSVADLIPGLHRGRTDANSMRQILLIAAGVGTMLVL